MKSKSAEPNPAQAGASAPVPPAGPGGSGLVRTLSGWTGRHPLAALVLVSQMAVVCLSEGHSGDFTATANGQPKSIITVNRAFKGIFLERPGHSHVEFTFRPRYWGTAVARFQLTALGVLVLAVVGLWRGGIGHGNCGVTAS
jgi:hypothetical protein